MKKFILALAVVAMTAGFSASAQDNKGKKGEGDFAKCELFEGVNLTDAQKDKIKAMNEKRAEARKAKKDEKAEKKGDKKAKRQAIMEARKQESRDFLAELKDILSPEQYTLFLENAFVNNSFQQQGQGRMNGRRDGQGGPRGPQDRPEGAPQDGPQGAPEFPQDME